MGSDVINIIRGTIHCLFFNTHAVKAIVFNSYKCLQILQCRFPFCQTLYDVERQHTVYSFDVKSSSVLQEQNLLQPYCCGSIGLVAAVQDLLQRYGIELVAVYLPYRSFVSTNVVLQCVCAILLLKLSNDVEEIPWPTINKIDPSQKIIMC